MCQSRVCSLVCVCVFIKLLNSARENKKKNCFFFKERDRKLKEICASISKVSCMYSIFFFNTRMDIFIILLYIYSLYIAFFFVLCVLLSLSLSHNKKIAPRAKKKQKEDVTIIRGGHIECVFLRLIRLITLFLANFARRNLRRSSFSYCLFPGEYRTSKYKRRIM